jgi:hypothetical protein
MSQAHQAQRFWESEVRWLRERNEDTVETEPMNAAAQGTLDRLWAAARPDVQRAPEPVDFVESIGRELEETSSWPQLQATRVARAFRPWPEDATVQQLEQELLNGGPGSVSAVITAPGDGRPEARFVAANLDGRIQWLNYSTGERTDAPTDRVTTSWDLAPEGRVLNPSPDLEQLNLDSATFEWIRSSVRDYVSHWIEPTRPDRSDDHLDVLPPRRPLGPYMATPLRSALRSKSTARSATSFAKRTQIALPLSRPTGLEITDAFLFRTRDGHYDFRGARDRAQEGDRRLAITHRSTGWRSACRVETSPSTTSCRATSHVRPNSFSPLVTS